MITPFSCVCRGNRTSTSSVAANMEWRPLRGCSFVVVLSVCSLAVSRHCDHHHYWDSINRVCRPCAKCPMNEIIRKPCSRLRDTVCGPFREFSYFNQIDSLDPPYTSYGYESFIGENSSGGDHTRDYPRKSGGLQNEPIVEKDDGEYWKNLAFALIGVVCVLIFVATVIVLLACRKLHETSAVKRPEEEDGEFRLLFRVSVPLFQFQRLAKLRVCAAALGDQKLCKYRLQVLVSSIP